MKWSSPAESPYLREDPRPAAPSPSNNQVHTRPRIVKRFSGRKNTSLLMLLNSLAQIMGKVFTMGLGFLTWMLAARLFATGEIGIASGVVAAMMLCTQVGLLGIGSAIIVLYPQYKSSPARLFDTAITFVAGAALLAGGGFLLLATSAFQELRVVASTPLYTLLFLVMSALGTVGILLDQTATTLRRGDQMLFRGLLSGLVTVASIAILPFATDAGDSIVIFSAWVVGAIAASGLGSIQLWRTLSHYVYRPRLELHLVRQLLRVGLPNWVLTLTERAPALVMPIVVTELLSPEANAYWYVIWMLSWVVFIVPVQVAMTLFAEAVHRPEAVRRIIQHGVKMSLALGLVSATAVALMASFVLSLLGADYAAAGTTPLRILVFSVIPVTFIQAYFATCRAYGRLREATVTGGLIGLISVVAAALAGIEYGLTGMAIAWLAVQSVAGLWASVRVRLVVLGGPAPESEGTEQGYPTGGALMLADVDGPPEHLGLIGSRMPKPWASHDIVR